MVKSSAPVPPTWRHGELQRLAELAERECLLNWHYSGPRGVAPITATHRLERGTGCRLLAPATTSPLKKAALAGTPASPSRRRSTMTGRDVFDGLLRVDYHRRSDADIRSSPSVPGRYLLRRNRSRCLLITCLTVWSAAAQHKLIAWWLKAAFHVRGHFNVGAGFLKSSSRARVGGC